MNGIVSSMFVTITCSLEVEDDDWACEWTYDIKGPIFSRIS